MLGAAELDPKQPWYSSRVEEITGAIRYEAFGPRGSFVMFQGPNAKADCDTFMNAVKNGKHRAVCLHPSTDIWDEPNPSRDSDKL